MKKIQILSILFALIIGAGCTSDKAPDQQSHPENFKMTTDIPESIVIPDKVETRMGTLEFFDGFPTDETVDKMQDFLVFHRAVDVFMDEMSAASMVALRDGNRDLGVYECNQMALFEGLMDSKA